MINIEKIKAYQKEYRRKNREKLLRQAREYYISHKEELNSKNREYYKNNKSKCTALSMAYYEKHKDVISQRMRSYRVGYYKKNRKWLLENSRLRTKIHRKEYSERQRRNRRERAIWLRNLKRGLCCAKCGEKHPACLDFHHIDPSQKDRDISRLVMRTSIKRVTEEMKKCDVLCANCHRKLHYVVKDEDKNE